MSYVIYVHHKTSENEPFWKDVILESLRFQKTGDSTNFRNPEAMKTRSSVELSDVSWKKTKSTFFRAWDSIFSYETSGPWLFHVLFDFLVAQMW